jgi:hypothetical protein
MSEQVNASNSGESEKTSSEAQGRQRSTIGFPYMDLGAANAVAAAIHDKAGHDQCSLQQLSAWMGTTTTSSTFRVQIAAARLFGVIESDGPDSYRLSSLGRRLVDPAHEKKAKVDAFLSVPLFNKLYELHKDGILPPTAALEREIASLGVSEKQKDRARQVFERSADLAGYFEHGKNRLVAPVIKGAAESKGESGSEQIGQQNGNSGSDGGGSEPPIGLDLDPLLIALLRKIPKAGEKWPKAQRLRWFKTFAMNVSQVYDDDTDVVDFDIKEAATNGGQPQETNRP